MKMRENICKKYYTTKEKVKRRMERECKKYLVREELIETKMKKLKVRDEEIRNEGFFKGREVQSTDV